MKVYVLDGNDKQAYDSKGEKRFIELQPCQQCKEFVWTKDEAAVIKSAVEQIWELADFDCAVFHAGAQTYSRRDWAHQIELGSLINPLKTPFEYDSDQIKMLKGVLLLAAFAGVSDIPDIYLKSAYEKIQGLILHLHNEHRDDQGAAYAPCHWFEMEYPGWINPERILYFLPATRGKTRREITGYLKEEWAKCKGQVDVFELS